MAKRAVARHNHPLPQTSESLWVEGPEAVQILGAGYTLPRLKAMGHRGEIVMDRKDPDKPNSPYIFLRQSLYDYNAQRVIQLNRQHKPKSQRTWAAKPGEERSAHVHSHPSPPTIGGKPYV
jgi:hypothetical protein